MPKITGAEERFSLLSVPAYARSSERVPKTLPLLYVEGLSTRDFDRVLRPFWKRAGLSRSSVSRANGELCRQFDGRKKRDLSKVFHAACLDEAKRAVGEFPSKYGEEFPTACEAPVPRSRGLPDVLQVPGGALPAGPDG